MLARCDKRHKHHGNVYAMTNASPNNEVVAFRRDDKGRLIQIGTFETGGSGTGEAKVDPLSSQGSLILSQDGRFLFAVNAGSNSMSCFEVDKHGQLTLTDVITSGGVRPNSLTERDHFIYVTNSGNAASGAASNVAGFRVDEDGHFSGIVGGSHALSTPTAQPACVVFKPDGSDIFVSELNTNLISAFHVDSDGALTGIVKTISFGSGPFGSGFLSRNILLVSEVGPNALSSYTADDGFLSLISGSVLNGQSATCWVAVARNEKFAYTSNAGSGTISTYRIKDDGKLSLLRVKYSTVKSIAAPIDSGVSRDGRNFYVLNGNQGSITVFRIGKGGQFTRLQVLKNTGLPTLGAQGLAVY